MSNETDWTGGEQDSNDIYPSQLLLVQRFILPSATGGKNVIAIARSQEIYITSLYALIVNAIFVAWWILTAIAIPHIIPRRFIHEPSVTIITSWKINEPLQALFPLAHHLWDIITSYRKSQRSKQSQQYLSIEPVKFSWGDFTITLITLILALGTFICGIVASIFLSKTFVLANAALANPDKLYYPVLETVLINREAPRLKERAITVIDNANPHGSTRKLLDSRVSFETILTDPLSDGRNEPNYTMHYTSSVTGYDMGLIHADDLNITTHGKCNFMDSVVVSEWGVEMITVTNDTTSPEAFFNCSNTPKGNITTTFYVIPRLLGLQVKDRTGASIDTDPWYFSTSSYIGSIEPPRPIIQCHERISISYRGWEGTFSDLRDKKVPGLHVSDAVIRILEIHFGQFDQRPYQNSYTCLFARPLQAHLTLGSARKMYNGYLDLDPEVTAANDIRRLVEGSYMYSKELFRSTATYYSQLMNYNSSREDVMDPKYNLLRTAEGEPVTSDFILYSENAAALRFEILVAIPTVLVFSWILVGIFWWLRLSPPESKSGEMATDTCKAEDEKPGWFRSVKTM
ncbi:hypothetical protein BDZ91DRAFT_750405 [Kalaharituber pfeilii]|nr:hypothetical protein BDZ91DRAFT_750405 [Kalaharituber pfeilii]